MTPRQADDVCALPLVRRLAAMLDRDPSLFKDGDPLPRGWYPILFNLPTRQSQLRDDGAGDLALPLPDLGLPRLMIAGRRAQFITDISIGARMSRTSRAGEPEIKEGRTGRFALVSVEHQIFQDDATQPALIETQHYVLKEAVPPTLGRGSAVESKSPAKSESIADVTRVLLPDERLLFRYSALTDNPHRIHYDRAYAREVEGYPDLIVNGTIPLMFLLEMRRGLDASAPTVIETRNLAPMLCGQPLRLCVRKMETGWRMWAEGVAGMPVFEALAS